MVTSDRPWLAKLPGRFGAGGGNAAKTVRFGRGRFQFRGFEADPAPKLADRFDYAPGRPALLELRDVLYLPDARCLYRADGARIEESRVTYIEPDAPAWFNADKTDLIEQTTMPLWIEPPPAPARITEPALFLGEVHDHYGHFITDTMTRMWALDRLGPTGKVLFAPDPKARLAPRHVQGLLGLLKLEPGRILRPDGPVLFETLLCPIPALQLSRIYRDFDIPHRAAAARALSGPNAPRPPRRPVYLTRRGLDAGLRKPGGEAELERRLEREGYLVIQPERLGLAEQIALFNGGFPVVGAFGSAMHTVLFRSRLRGQKLAMLLPEKIPPRFAMVDAVKGSRATYIECIFGDPDPNPVPGEEPAERVWSIDAEAAMDHLSAAGFLKR